MPLKPARPRPPTFYWLWRALPVILHERRKAEITAKYGDA